MNGFLSRIGLLSITVLIIYAISKIDEYCYLKKEENKSHKYVEDDDE